MNILLLMLTLSHSYFPQEDTLTILAKNVQVGKGTVFVSLWNDEKTLFKDPYISKSHLSDSSTLEFSFVLPEGQYAISVYQDINDNKKLDLGAFNIPKEPIGFGNNFRPKFSAPKFKDCAISLTQNLTTVIELK